MILSRPVRRPNRPTEPTRKILAVRTADMDQAIMTCAASLARPSVSSTLATMPLASRPTPAEKAFFEDGLRHERAETADRAFLDRDQHFVIEREPHDEVEIERLGKA